MKRYIRIIQIYDTPNQGGDNVNYSILIVENEKYILRGLVDHNPWQAWGFNRVLEARNGKEALEIVSKEYPDVIITDIRMPIMDGIDMIKQLRFDGNNVPIVILSGYSEFEYARRGIEYNVIGYILKPIKNNELLENVERIKSLLENKGTPSTPLKDKIDEIIVYIEKNYQQEISIKSLAQKVHFSVSHFNRRFRERICMSPVEYVNRVRIDHAKLLLEKKHSKSYEVAYKVGFFDVGYFCRVFKSLTGVTPKEYKKLVSKENEE